MNCRLCTKEKELQNSHIIPEFFHKPGYDAKGRMIRLSTIKDEKNEFMQKGLREKLLCWDCEQYFNDSFEKYVYRRFYKKPTIRDCINDRICILKGIDYKKFKLFQLSILWRASIASNREFAEVQLGIKHEEKIRMMLLDKQPGQPHEYGCALVSLFTDEIIPIDGSIRFPLHWKYKDHDCYEFVFGGLKWLFVVSSKSDQFPFRKAFIQPNGDLTIINDRSFVINFMDSHVRRFRESGKIGDGSNTPDG